MLPPPHWGQKEGEGYTEQDQTSPAKTNQLQMYEGVQPSPAKPSQDQPTLSRSRVRVVLSLRPEWFGLQHFLATADRYTTPVVSPS